MNNLPSIWKHAVSCLRSEYTFDQCQNMCMYVKRNNNNKQKKNGKTLHY